MSYQTYFGCMNLIAVVSLDSRLPVAAVAVARRLVAAGLPQPERSVSGILKLDSCDQQPEKKDWHLQKQFSKYLISMIKIQVYSIFSLFGYPTSVL